MKIDFLIRKWWDPEAAIASVEATGQYAALQLAEYVAERARYYCPVLTGRLRESIQVVSSADLMSHWVIATMPYAEPVEFGYTMRNGRRMAPRAFMRRAVRDGADRFPRIIGDARVRQGYHRGAVMGAEFRAA